MGTPIASTPLVESARPYLDWLDSWLASRPSLRLTASRAAMIVVDMIEGFCEHGALASPRVAAVIDPIGDLLRRYQAHGGTRVLLTEDAHREGTREFASFPPHCLAGTSEARTVAPLAALEQLAWQRVPKQTINGLAEPEARTAVEEWVRNGITHLVVVGNCTDLCVYQAAMAAQLLLNREEFRPYAAVEVVVPVSAVATYDLGVAAATELGAQPHPGDFLHAVFLHHMALNGILVPDSITWSA